ncbi:hypothetical protein [Oenococcus oeni]|uniref:hypothetical protein n=1 Tax=Oenococcus oeni TaxID=1247 RepID=UPI000A9EC58E|nr:hypothetical protein [Oenococcus oeni]
MIKKTTITSFGVFVLIKDKSNKLIAFVKHLPKNKSGIGSGIVNAARQIGTCLGIAILVTVLNNNVNTAKQNIHQNATGIINQEKLSPRVKTTARQQFNKVFAISGSTKLTSKNKEANLKRALKSAAKSKKDLPQPKRGTDLYRAYQAESKLNSANQMIVKNNQKIATTLAVLGKENDAMAKIASASKQLSEGNQRVEQGQKSC